MIQGGIIRRYGKVACDANGSSGDIVASDTSCRLGLAPAKNGEETWMPWYPARSTASSSSSFSILPLRPMVLSRAHRRAEVSTITRILVESCQASMARAELWPASDISDKAYLYAGLRPSGGTPPLHHPCTSGAIPIGARQHRPFSSFTSPLSTPIFYKTSHRPPHTPNSFTFTRFQTPLTQSPSRVQNQIPDSLSRAQARFAPQGFWSSGPRAFSHPGFCGLILYIVDYPILGSYLTPSRAFGFILHIF